MLVRRTLKSVLIIGRHFSNEIKINTNKNSNALKTNMLKQGHSSTCHMKYIVQILGYIFCDPCHKFITPLRTVMPLDQIMNMRYKHDLLQYIRKISESEYEGLEKHFRNQDEDFKNVFDGHVEKQLITNIFL